MGQPLASTLSKIKKDQRNLSVLRCVRCGIEYRLATREGATYCCGLCFSPCYIASRGNEEASREPAK